MKSQGKVFRLLLAFVLLAANAFPALQPVLRPGTGNKHRRTRVAERYGARHFR